MSTIPPKAEKRKTATPDDVDRFIFSNFRPEEMVNPKDDLSGLNPIQMRALMQGIEMIAAKKKEILHDQKKQGQSPS